MPKRSTRRTPSARDYPRTARLNELFREILAESLETVDDDRLELITVTSVVVDADLHHATVYYDSWQGEEGDASVLEALDEARPKLKRALGRQARIKRVPELGFKPDPALRAGQRIEEILRVIEAPDADRAEPDPADDE